MIVGEYRTTIIDQLATLIMESFEGFPITHGGFVDPDYVSKSIHTWTKAVITEHMPDSDLAGKCARAGLLYFAGTAEEVRSHIDGKIFKHGSKLPNLVVVKSGGSALDSMEENKLRDNLGIACSILSRIHTEREFYEEETRAPTSKPVSWREPDGTVRSEIRTTKARVVRKLVVRPQRIIMTAGLGPIGNYLKTFNAKYRHLPAVRVQIPRLMAIGLQLNLGLLSTLFAPDKKTGHGGAELLTSGAYYRINETSTSQAIPLVPTAPHWVMVKQGIPLTDSDTGTLALAELYGAERVVLLKRTDGIYKYDPYRGYRPNPHAPYGCQDSKAWQEAQRANQRYSSVTVDNLIAGTISREGTAVTGLADGSGGHLMEDSGLKYFQDHCTSVKEIVVVHIAPEELWVPKGHSTYQHIVTREQLQLDHQSWSGYLETKLRQAIRGRAHSKIVR